MLLFLEIKVIGLEIKTYPSHRKSFALDVFA